MYSIQFDYSELNLFLINSKLETLSTKISGRAIVGLMFQFSILRSNEASDKNFNFIRIKSFGMGMELVCQSIRSILERLSYTI